MKVLPWLAATGIVYVPLIAPFFVGPLTECEHCVAIYTSYAPLGPAFGFDWFLQALFGIKAVPDFSSIGGSMYRVLVTIAMVALARWTIGRRPAIACIGAALLAAWVGVHGIFFTVMLRM